MDKEHRSPSEVETDEYEELSPSEIGSDNFLELFVIVNKGELVGVVLR